MQYLKSFGIRITYLIKGGYLYEKGIDIPRRLGWA